MRKLRFHEQKLLRKVDFLQWKNEHNLREVATMRRYHIQDRDDYKKYNKLCGMVTRMVRGPAACVFPAARRARGAVPGLSGGRRGKP